MVQLLVLVLEIGLGQRMLLGSALALMVDIPFVGRLNPGLELELEMVRLLVQVVVLVYLW